jgi:hypothetical protein
MLIFLVLAVVPFLVVHIQGESPHLNGYYHMLIPGNGNQYVFFIDWSPSLSRYLVTVTGAPLAWATATLDTVNDTGVALTCDTGDLLSGTIEYRLDLPSICWPGLQVFPCWNRLLSNITRIHVINM